MKFSLLLAVLATTGLAAPVTNPNSKSVAILKAKRNFDGIYVVPGEDGESVEKKRSFDGIYVVPGEDGESVEKKRNFDGIYVVPGEDGESVERK